MSKLITFFIFLVPFFLFSQDIKIKKINWIGTKKMDEKFMLKFIQSKEGESLDSLMINHDIQSLTRLNGISKVTYEVIINDINKAIINFTLIENFSIIPIVNVWTTIDSDVAFKTGLYDFNLLGKNISFGGFYQNNQLNSFGLNYSAPFLFSENLGIESNFQSLGSIEPIFLETGTSKYEYINLSFEALLLYRTNYKNTIKIGGSIFNEKYTYLSGATSSSAPLNYSVDKFLIKFVNFYDNLKYEFYLVDGMRNSTNFQYVAQTGNLQNQFFICWNDFTYLKRIGKKGNFGTRIRLGLSSNDDSPFAPFALDNNLNLRGVGNIIDRGTGSFVINTEYRTTFFEKNWFVLQSNAFVDFGTWRKPGGTLKDFVQSENVRVFPGLGIRFIHKTIFNAIFRIDYGFGINENGAKGLVFGVGQYF